MEFHSLYAHGFARIAAVTDRTQLADPKANANTIIDAIRDLSDQGVAIAMFPELYITGYSIDDLVTQQLILDEVVEAIEIVAAASVDLLPVIIFGAPLFYENRLYNCAVVIHRGQVKAVVPKSYLPSYREFYETRHFASGAKISSDICLAGKTVPFGTDLLFEASDLPGLRFHIEICEDMWIPVPPSALAALAGANVLINISGSPITVSRADDRALLCKSASSRCLAAYVYCAGGTGESTTDLAWDGQAMIFENGVQLASNERFDLSPSAVIADVDLELIQQARLRQGTFDDNAKVMTKHFRIVEFNLCPPHGDFGLRREVSRFPFVPYDESQLDQNCYEAYHIQISSLSQRLQAIGQPKVVIGLSGGLDSTHALLVAARTMDQLGRPRSDILAYNMPGFATSEHTRRNAMELAKSLGCSFDTIDIQPAAEQMLSDIGHPYSEGEDDYDITFQNVQSGLRTDYLFRLANYRDGIVLGTGDLSELALGWCTYGVGDQMSHYGVNAGIPKTLIQHLIRWVIATEVFDQRVISVLKSILATEISPELIPVKPGETLQSTQAQIGPYELQDFNLYWFLRYGFRPSKIAFLAHHSWADISTGQWPREIEGVDRHTYQLDEIKKWLRVFLRRFVLNQFKRSALPNGPKVVSGGSLSPRGDWRMPSDVSPQVWLTELEQVPDHW